MTGAIADYWNTPEALTANKRDRILKELEIRAIGQYVKDGMRVLDAGCGDGETLAHLFKSHACHLTGIDGSVLMIDRAREEFGVVACGLVKFDRVDLRDASAWAGDRRWDLIYTERCLINLPTWEVQAQAIRDCCALLKPGGQFVMCEHSQDGLDETNEWRAKLNLPAIVPPSHNRYLRDAEVYGYGALWDGPGDDVTIQDFAGLYYFLSRIVNAKLAADVGQEPSYDSLINKLALDLPLGPGPQEFRGYGRAWCFRKC